MDEGRNGTTRGAVLQDGSSHEGSLQASRRLQGRKYHQGAEKAQEGGLLGIEDPQYAAQGMDKQLARNSKDAGRGDLEAASIGEEPRKDLGGHRNSRGRAKQSTIL